MRQLEAFGLFCIEQPSYHRLIQTLYTEDTEYILLYIYGTKKFCSEWTALGAVSHTVRRRGFSVKEG